MTLTEGNKIVSSHQNFDLVQVGEGVFAAIGWKYPAAFSNAGIVDLGDRTLVFDTMSTHMAGKELHKVAEELTGGWPNCVILSHGHSDHYCGNQAFDSLCWIISTIETRQDMIEFSEDLQKWKEDPTEFDQEIQDTQVRLAQEKDPRWRATLEIFLERLLHEREDLPTLEIRPPDFIFDSKLIIHGTKRRAELFTITQAHTSKDTYMVLPSEGIVFTGDLGFFQQQPFLPYGDPERWQAWLTEMENLDHHTFIPGHGPIGTKTDLSLQREYIHYLDKLVSKIAQGGGALEDIKANLLPESYKSWLTEGMMRFETNVQFLYERAVGGK